MIRQVNAAGGFAAVVRRGSGDAGSIFICVPERGGGTALYGQAPQILLADRDKPAAGGRLFEKLGDGLSTEELDTRFEKEARFDPDFWVVELELSGQEIGDLVDLADAG